MKVVDVVSAVLLVAGGLNWGLVGAFDFDLVAATLGKASTPTSILYTVIGLCAVYQGSQWRSIQRRWEVAEALG